MYLLASGKSRDRVFALSGINCFNLKLLMRATLLSVAFLTCLVTVANTSSGQSTNDKVTVRFSDMSLKKVLRELEKTTKFNFTWRSTDVENSPVVNYEATNEYLFKVLGNVLAPAGLSFVQRGNSIVLVRRPATPFTPIINNEDGKVNITLIPVYDTVPTVHVRGRVTSSEKLGEPVPNASVTVKGNRIGVMTDPDGYFTMRVPVGSTYLVFTQISFEPVEVRIEYNSPMSVAMKPRAQAMTEVVTTGLYKRPKESFTGAATTISGDQIRSVSMTNALQAIKMFDPSIRIPDNVQFGSDPNRMPNISIRGTNNFPQTATTTTPPSGADFMASYSYNPNQPIFILDGFEVSLQKIYDLDINRIASYTILKDASATSMYGSRAANGVIIVDTKQPAPGKLQVSYSGTANMNAPDLSVYNLLNAREKLDVEKIAGVYTRYKNDNGSGASLDAYWRNLLSLRESYVAKGVNTDWMALPLRNAIGSNHSINLGGGDQFIRYQLNLNYKSDPGVMKGSTRNVYSGDMSLSYRFKGFNIRNAMSLTYNKGNNSPYGKFSDYTKQNAYWSPYDENGGIVKVMEGYGDLPVRTNPLYNSTLNVIDNSEYTQLNNNTELEWILGKGFRINGYVGLTRQTDEMNVFLPASHTSFAAETNFLKRGSYKRTYTKFFNIQSRITANYSRRIGLGHLFNTALVEMNQGNRNGLVVTVEGFPNENLNDILFGNGYPVNSKPSGYTDITRRLSAGDNFSFTWDQRYVVEGSLRFDGSSQFGSNKRYAAFWSLGGSWNVHHESFIQQYHYIDMLRVRASIGSTGDDRFSTNQAITTYQYYTSSSFHGLTGSNLISYGNPDLTWQQGIKKNIGFDLTMFDKRLQVTGNLYNETTKSLLLDVNTPPSVGVSSYKENSGKLQNNGFELNTTVALVQQPKKDLFWNVFVNIAHNKKKIVEIANSLQRVNAVGDSMNNKQVAPQNKYVEGYSTDVIWGVRSLGIDPSTGREMFLTADNKLTYTWSPKDKVIIGDPTGGVFGNFGTSVRWKGFSLYLGFNYQFGIDKYNQTLADRVENLDLTWQGDKRVLYDRWKKPGDKTFFKGLADENGYTVSTPTYVTSRFIQRDNYINFQTISAGYELPARITKRFRMNTTRITLIANEIARWGAIEMERGLDYPFARTFSFNLTCNF
jgi:TonB-linked SusC/RagA family outer membrane protein